MLGFRFSREKSLRQLPVSSVAASAFGLAAFRRRLVVLLAWMLLCFVIAVPTAGAADWRYAIRTGDTLWTIAQQYLREDVPVVRLQRYNRIVNPYRLPPGGSLSVPVDWLRHQPFDVRIEASRGQASASRTGSFRDAIPAIAGLRLGAGAALRTLADGSLTLAFADGSRLQLHGNSELHLERLNAYGDTGMFDIRLSLPRGRISSLVAPLRGEASHYVVTTPGMMSSVRGTVFRVAANEQGEFTEVLSGAVAASGEGHQVRLDAGFGTAKGDDGRPMPSVRLLPPPDLAQLPSRVLRVPAPLVWGDVAGAAAYRVQASAQQDFSTLLQDVRVSVPRAPLDVHHEGELFVRIRAIDGHGIEGQDAQGRLEIAAQPAPPFVLRPQEGSTVYGAQPRLQWTDQAEGEYRYRVELIESGGDFARPRLALQDIRGTDVRLAEALPPGDYQWRIATSDATGKQGAWSEPMRFSLAPAQSQSTTAESGEAGLSVRWEKGLDGQRYRFQLSSRADFARPRVDSVLDENHVQLADIRYGTWYLRVAAIDEDGYQHPYGPVQTVKLGCLPCRILGGSGAASVLLFLML